MSERTYTFEEKRVIENFKSTQKHICYYCGKELTEAKDTTVDHRIPFSRGGKTIPENLVISCESCNLDKDNMTEQEYLMYKKLQMEAKDTYEVAKDIEELLKLHNKIIFKIEKVKKDYEKTETTIQTIQENMMLDNFNACEGYVYSRNLKEMLLVRNDLSYLREGYKPLHIAIGNHKKQLSELKQKITNDLYNLKKPLLKKIVKKDDINNNDNVVNINKLKVVASN